MASIRQSHPDALTRQLKVDMAYHSHLMQPLADEYKQLLLAEIGEWQQQDLSSTCAFYSTITEGVYHKQFSSSYWVDNMLSCVKFDGAFKQLLSQGKEQNKSLLFMEVGAHSQLHGPIRQICADLNEPFEYVSTLVRGEICSHSLLSAYGKLFQHGVRLSLPALITTKVDVPITNLPAYPWEHKSSFWSENTLSKVSRNRKQPRHSLLGMRVGASTIINPMWRNLLRVADVPWLQDHNVDNCVVFPFAGYIAMAVEAIRQIVRDKDQDTFSGCKVRRVSVLNPLIISDDESRPVELITTLKPQRLTDSLNYERYEFTIMASPDGSDDTLWKKHCQGSVEVCKAAPPESEPSITQGDDGFPRKVSSKRFYNAMYRMGHKFGPQFNTLSNLEFSTTSSRSRAHVTNYCSRAEFVIDPATIDGCLQLLIMLSTRGYIHRIEDSLVPTMLEDITLLKPESQAAFLTADAWSETGDGLETVNGVKAIANGQTILTIKGLKASKLTKPHQSPEEKNQMYGACRLEWVPDMDFLGPTTTVEAPKMAYKMFSDFGILIADADARIKRLGSEPKEIHLNKFKDWVHNVTSNVAALTEFAQLPDSERESKIEAVLQQLAHDPATTATSESGRTLRLCGLARQTRWNCWA